ncbi:homoserine dehydrogenase [Thermoanaerobacter mathranii subsp. mathranii str. A3]|uniref:Homoserine dehydrogenase n=1 Tax=Thermoanaerobacter mathranii subsp. mathranii (strain DSM 11426 / CCUG 53645 / CIP 108742 / A3) TaxID=583358 RepID=A0ABN3Z3N2_THEM3|nr:homoserine dehydrogenase [Thermoanaerobacter mathranii]ADH61510.1 homoserine dehydrogenase [Thermoanaerobacter mathranii subsp. mathranii str. A3]MDK2815019.1 homoserine dehydrogenase [Thermoanaerobacter sp.]
MTVKIGLLGLGTVGTGVYKLITSRGGHIKESTGVYPEIKKILVKNLNKPRKVKVEGLLTQNAEEILKDKEIKIVIEAIGGIYPAYEYVKEALLSGKHVITANKELIAQYGEELNEIAEKNRVFLKCEASVGGAIPILHQIDRLKITDEIDFVGGIVNGTTNYILTKMTTEGRSYEEALKEAQQLGYAEANPDYDVKGFDALYKLVILMREVFNINVPINSIPRKGIDEITTQDLNYSNKWGYKIKLFAWGKKVKDGIFAGVEPVLVEENNILSRVNDVNNAIILRGDSFGEYVFVGKGAGELPTGDAVVADLIDILLNYDIKDNLRINLLPIRQGSFTDTFYIRLKLYKEDILGLKKVLKFLKEQRVSIVESSSENGTFAAIVKTKKNVEELIEKLEEITEIKAFFKVLQENIIEELKLSEFEDFVEVI